MVHATQRTKCRLCDHDGLELAVPLRPTPLAEKYLPLEAEGTPTPTYPVDVYLCLRCGHAQLLEILDPQVVYADYTYRSAGTPKLVAHFDDCVALVTEITGRSPPFVVDIGSNDGSLLAAFQRQGAKVLGVDPADVIAAEATANGIPTLPDFFDSQIVARITEEHGRADVVCAFNVYAHADDLAGMTRAIADLLADDGVFMFEVSYALDILDHMLLGTIFHEHLSHHAIGPLVPFFERCGLELVHVARNDIQGGSVVGIAQRRGGPLALRPSVGELIALEDSQGVCRPAAWHAFNDKLEQARTRTHQLLGETLDEGAALWGYGAARSGTTLIAQLGLAPHLGVIVDDHPDKCGKLSPGDHIPVRPTADLLQEKPAAVIILAWIHTDAIIAAAAEYVRRGGVLIRCFPDVSVVTEAELP